MQAGVGAKLETLMSEFKATSQTGEDDWVKTGELITDEQQVFEEMNNWRHVQMKLQEQKGVLFNKTVFSWFIN